MSDISVDGFRFISNVHTTARQLRVCSQIVNILGANQIPRKLIRELIVKWSLEQEEKNIYYKISKGKITDNGKETSTLRYYLELTHALGLTTRFNNFFSNTNRSYVLLHFLESEITNRSLQLSLSEKIFYLFQLLYVDADGIFLVLEILKETRDANQVELQKKCKDVLNKRLLAKQEIAPQLAKIGISEKYRIVNFVWKKPDKYAEHIISPRLEWLSNLGLVEIKRSGSSTSYNFTRLGEGFYEALPGLINDKAVKDINEIWIFSDFFSLANNLFDEQARNPYQTLSLEEKKAVLSTSLRMALNVVKTSSSFRFPLLDTLLFICMDIFITKNIVLNFSEIMLEFVNGFTLGNKQYFLKEAARINESYITTRVIE